MIKSIFAVALIFSTIAYQTAVGDPDVTQLAIELGKAETEIQQLRKQVDDLTAQQKAQQVDMKNQLEAAMAAIKKDDEDTKKQLEAEIAAIKKDDEDTKKHLQDEIDAIKKVDDDTRKQIVAIRKVDEDTKKQLAAISKDDEDTKKQLEAEIAAIKKVDEDTRNDLNAQKQSLANLTDRLQRSASPDPSGTCSSYSTQSVRCEHSGSIDSIYCLDSHDIRCPNGRFLTHFHFIDEGVTAGRNFYTHYEYVCCSVI